jgi:hypothetical protein
MTSTYTSNGLEVWQPATNGFLQSDDLSNAAWFAGGQNPTVVSTGNAATGWKCPCCQDDFWQRFGGGVAPGR